MGSYEFPVVLRYTYEVLEGPSNDLTRLSESWQPNSFSAQGLSTLLALKHDPQLYHVEAVRSVALGQGVFFATEIIEELVPVALWMQQCEKRRWTRASCKSIST